MGFRDFETDHRLHFVAFSFAIFIGGFNGHRETKLAKSEIANMIFEQKREETKSEVCSKTQKNPGFSWAQTQTGTETNGKQSQTHRSDRSKKWTHTGTTISHTTDRKTVAHRQTHRHRKHSHRTVSQTDRQGQKSEAHLVVA